MGGLSPDARAALERIVAAVTMKMPGQARIESPTGPLDVPVAGPAGPAGGLAEALYGRFYIVPCPVPQQAEAGFLDRLRAANPVSQRFEDGWTVAVVEPGAVLLADPRGRQRRASPAEVVPVAGALAPGGPVRLAVARETVTAPNGHYVIFGRPIRDARSGRQARFYWNVAPAGAAGLLTALGSALERRRIPFQAKVPVAPALYGRADCGVLYLNFEDIEASLDIVADIRAAAQETLRDETPLFARRLAPGLAFAESPPTNESFGMQRCRLVAEGLVSACGRGATEPEARIEAICERFLHYGLDPGRLERNPSSLYPYRLETIESRAA